MVNIRRQIATDNSKHYAGTNGQTSITIHETANTAAGATAAAHANLQSNGGARNASWHYTVDDKEAVQSFEQTVQCWHAGDGRGNGNLNSVAIEICVNDGGDFVKAVHNAAELVQAIGISNIVQHNHWSGKNCPTFLRSGERGITWDDFINLVNGQPTVITPPAPEPGRKQIAVDGLWGGDVTQYLQETFGTPVDRVVSSQSSYWKQFNPGLTVGWDWVSPRAAQGSTLIRTMQGWLGIEADGLAGHNFFANLQNRLGTYSDGTVSYPSQMVMELQRRLNAGTLL